MEPFPPLSGRLSRLLTGWGRDKKHQGEVESCPLLETWQIIPTHLSLLPDFNVVGIQETLASEIQAVGWGPQVLGSRRRNT